VQFLRDLLLRRKLMLIMMLSSCVTLGVACVAWFYGDWKNSRETHMRQLSLLADVIGSSVASGIHFGDREAVEADILMLAQRPSIRCAAVFNLEGELLASYSAASAALARRLPYRSEGKFFERGGLTVYTPIQLKGERLGTVGIESDLTEIVERQIEFARSVLAVLLLCLLVAFGMSYRLQQFISTPVLRLADTAREVSQRKDYSLRAEKLGRDELGYLTDSFNAMLAAIQERDAALQETRATLEQQVAARTRELVEKNERLQVSMEEARAASLTKAQFLANMSHEIRTPMNGVLGMNELLLESALDEQQRSYAEIVKTSAEALLQIINDILDFSKIEAGKLRLESIEFDLYRTVEEVVSLLGNSARKKRLGLATWIQPAIPRAVRGDPTRLRQVLTNLVNNAIKFTENGKVTLRVELIDELDKAVRVRFLIEDTGIGIGQERQKKLFQPFTQVDASTTRRYGGTGLGLAISKQLVEMMGGEIGLSSELGVGSTFWFTSRFERLPAGAFRSFLLPEGSTRPRVLVADASAAARETLHQQLSAWGLEHELASDAGRALSCLRRAHAAGKPFGLMLLDGELCSKEELASFLRFERPPLRPKVVLLTWGGIADEEAGHCECVASLVKPLRPSQLFDVLIGVLGEDEEMASLAELGRDRGLARERVDPPRSLAILLAEDNAINQIVARKILAKGGYACDVVADGKQAVEALRARAYDVVLMDCQMPELDGFEATKLIRAIEQEELRSPRAHVIALTANAMKGDRERCIEAGMDDYLPKPVKPDLLLAKLRQVGLTQAERPAANLPAPPFDVALLAARFAGRPDELRAALEELERRAAGLLAQIDASLRRADEQALRAHVAELRVTVALLSSQRLGALAEELETLTGRGLFAEASSALHALGAELGSCSAFAPEALARAATGVSVDQVPAPMPRSPTGVATAKPASDAPGNPDNRRAG